MGYPERFLGNESSPFNSDANMIWAIPVVVSKMSTMLAFGYISSSTASTAIASFGLYAQATNQPGARLTSAVDVNLRSSIQEISITPIVLPPGTYYIAILTHDSGEPKLFTSPTTMIDWWVSPANYMNGLPSLFSAVAPEVFTFPAANLYIVVTQAASP